MNPTPEEELFIALCAKQNPPSLDLLGNRYGRPVYSLLICALGGDRGLAKDILLTHFRAVLNNIVPYEEKVPFILRVLERISDELLSAGASDTPFTDLPAEITESPLTAAMIKALSKLSMRDRLQLLLRDLIGCSCSEITAVMKLKKKCTRDEISAIRAQFRLILEQLHKPKEPS